MTLLTSLKQAMADRFAGDRIPYGAHLSPHNVSTDKGDVVTVFKLVGVSHEAADDDDLLTWHEILSGFIRGIGSDQVAIWSHTVRKFESAYPDGEFETGTFADRLNERYRKSLAGTQMLINEHYVTLVYRHPTQLLKGRVSEEAAREEIREKNKNIDDLAAQLMASLDRWSPSRLGIYTKGNVRYSEVAEFFALLLNGEHTPVPIPRGPLRYGMMACRPFFGIESAELRHANHSRYLAAVGVNEDPESTEPGKLNILLTQPFPFVLVQSFSCLSKSKAEAAMKAQQRRLLNTKDAGESQIDDINAALDDLISGRITLGEHHLNLFVIADDRAQLGKNASMAVAALTEEGFKALREDLCLEAAYWAQLPGVFNLRPRKSPLTNRNYAGLASMHNYPSGKAKGNQWGDALTLLKTNSGTPFYFNLHLPTRKRVNEDEVDDRVAGHTLMLGPTGAGKTVVQTFLLAQAEKYKPTVFSFDKDQGQEIFIRAMGGRYFNLKMGEPTGFNPFDAPDTPAQRLMVEALVKRCAGGGPLSASRESELTRAVAGLFGLPQDQRQFGSLLDFLDVTDPDGLAARLNKWTRRGEGSLAFVFDNPSDRISLSGNRYFGFDMTAFLDNDDVRSPAVMYLFHRMEELIDGRRFIGNMDEFWKLLLDQYFETKALDAVKTWRKRNALAMFGTQSPQDVLSSKISSALIEQCVTQLYLPNPKARTEDYIDGFKLSRREYQIVRDDMVRDNIRGFLAKQGANACICELNLRGFDDELAVLSSTATTVELAQRAIRQTSDDPSTWLPVFQSMRRSV